MAIKYQVRSVSLPARSHPTDARIDHELGNVRSLEASSASTSGVMCSSLTGLEELHNCMDNYLAMQSTQEVLRACKEEAWITEMLEGSVRILDICGTLRDTLLQLKGHVQDLQSALRRRKGDSSAERSISSFLSFRKKMLKDARKMIAALKQADHKLKVSPVKDMDPDRLCVVSTLTEVAAVNSSIFESLLSFLSVSPSSSKMTKWSLVSRLMNKRVAACGDESMNEFASTDTALMESYSGEKSPSKEMLHVIEKLAALEKCAARIEDSLESFFRRLVRSRVSLLNIFSC